MVWGKDIGENILIWNSLYPLDRYYRKKYKIGFGSAQHKETNQVDILLDLFEETIIENAEQERQEYEANLEAISRGEIRGTATEDREAGDTFERIATQIFGEEILRELEDI